MVQLEVNQIKEKIKTPQNLQALKASKRHEERLCFHVEPVLEKKHANEAHNRFLEGVQGFLPDEKYKRFEQLFQYPVPTNELTEAIFSELSRALHGDGGLREIKLATETQEAQFNEYLAGCNLDKFFKNEGWQAFKTAPHSVMIVDMPAEENETAQPYAYLLNICNVIDMDVSAPDAPCNYIIFKDPSDSDLIHAFDGVYYRSMRKQEEGEEYLLISEVEHNVGYCPAKPFWSTNLNSRDNIQKLGALTKSLAQLDKVLFWETSIEYYNTYGVFPVIWAYERKADEEDTIGSDHQDFETMGGEDIPYYGHHPAWNEERERLSRHKTNEGKHLIGAGSFVEVPAPADSQDADLRDPFGYMQINVDSLKFADSYLQKRKDMVFTYCVGSGGEPVNDQAKNEKQVQSAFESKINILSWVAEQFDIAENWLVKTKAILMFGAESVSSVQIMRGRKFYLKTAKELSEQYQQEKSAGLPMFLVSQTRQMITETKYRGNEQMLTRNQILEDLEPYPDLTIKEVQEFSNRLNPMQVSLKLNFDYFVRKFEREELPLLRFGSATSYANKIKAITAVLMQYVQEAQPAQEVSAGGTETPPQTNGEGSEDDDD